MRRSMMWAAWAALSVASGCKDDPACVEGAAQACACASGQMGAQTCRSGAFGACVCAGDADGGVPEAGPADALAADAAPDAAPDGGASPDAREDASALDAAEDAGPVDSGLPAFCTRFPQGYAEIPAGTYFMGARPQDRPPGMIFDNEEPRHGVEITRPFWMKVTEVTQAEWDEIGPTLPNPSARMPLAPDCPVENMSWHQAVDWLNELSRKCGLTPCYADTAAGREGQVLDLDCEGYRLPTEAEWEYAARAGTIDNTYNGQSTIDVAATSSPILDPIAWYQRDNMSLPTKAVGLPFRPNAWGLYDVLGNVMEWVSDGYAPYVDAPLVRDPQGPALPARRVLRGGSRSYPPVGVRAPMRVRTSEGGGGDVGFRIARRRM